MPDAAADPRPLGAAVLLTLRGIEKHFGGVAALSGVDFELRAGEIHALLGENGAGKSTLIKVLGGIHRPEAGEIRIDGRPASIHHVADADRYGIRIIHQELALAANLSIAENVFLGREPGRLGLISRRRIFREAEALLAELDLAELPPVETPVGQLTVAQQQLVEIARALSCAARILVLDEPTSSLALRETESLFVTLRRLRARGTGIIYISHRLEEIIRLADRITVLRDGRSIGTQAAAGVDRGPLIRWMAGRAVVEQPRPRGTPGEVALRAVELVNHKLRGVSFELRYGEVLGLAGLVGSGRSELARALFGIDPLESGQIMLDGRPLRIRHPRDAISAGLVLVPEDRKREGLVMTHSLAFNLTLPWLDIWLRPGRPDYRQRAQIARRAIDALGIRAAGLEQPVETLSGGNQQKVLVGRWLEKRPKVLLLDEPTRGVDVAARAEMFSVVAQLVETGLAVLLISSDLAEVLGMAHRVAVYRDGRILEILPAATTTLEEVLHRLTGAAGLSPRELP